MFEYVEVDEWQNINYRMSTHSKTYKILILLSLLMDDKRTTIFLALIYFGTVVPNFMYSQSP